MIDNLNKYGLVSYFQNITLPNFHKILMVGSIHYGLPTVRGILNTPVPAFSDK